MARQWEPIVAEFSRVMKMVHLALRRDAIDITSIANDLFKQKRQAYEDGLTAQAANAGCAGRKGVMPNDKLTQARDEANQEAAGIANTFNYDLAIAIRFIKSEVPKANRWTYVKRLRDWEETRDGWKSSQIALWNQTKWANIAFQDFLAHNPNLNNGYAILQPKRTVCEFCQYWAKKGRVPMLEAVRVEFPAHVNCPHYWETHYKGKINCEELWMGADVKQWWEDIEAGKELGEKGGLGSGNFGHVGRPGLVGGSGSGGGIPSESEVDVGEIGEVKPFHGKLYHFTRESNVNGIQEQGLKPSGMALMGKAVFLTLDPEYSEKTGYTHGNVRLEVQVDADKVLNAGDYLAYAKWLIDRGYEHVDPAKAFLSEGIQAAWFRDDGSQSLAVFDPSLIKIIGMNKELGEKGGPGSGNFGHSGRPGLVGGSGSGGVSIANVQDSKRVDVALSTIPIEHFNNVNQIRGVLPTDDWQENEEGMILDWWDFKVAAYYSDKSKDIVLSNWLQRGDPDTLRIVLQHEVGHAMLKDDMRSVGKAIVIIDDTPPEVRSEPWEIGLRSSSFEDAGEFLADCYTVWASGDNQTYRKLVSYCKMNGNLNLDKIFGRRSGG